MDLQNLTISQVKEGFKTKAFSCVKLVQYYLDRIESQKDLNTFITILKDEALNQAKEVDEKIAKGEELNSLEGVPISVKDIILTKGVKTTGGSKILSNYIASYDATIVRKLKEQGVIILGKTNCDEFAMGSSNENSAFGAVKNPSTSP